MESWKICNFVPEASESQICINSKQLAFWKKSSYGIFVTTFACLILKRNYNSPRTVSLKVLTLPVAAQTTFRALKGLNHVFEKVHVLIRSRYRTWLSLWTIFFASTQWNSVLCHLLRCVKTKHLSPYVRFPKITQGKHTGYRKQKYYVKQTVK